MNIETNLHTHKFEPNIHQQKSKVLHPLCSLSQHQSSGWKPTNPSKQKIISNLETHRSPLSSKSHHSQTGPSKSQPINPQIYHKITTPICHKPKLTKITTHKPTIGIHHHLSPPPSWEIERWERETHRFERETHLSKREREIKASKSREDELEPFGFGFERNPEIERMGLSEKEKKEPPSIVVVVEAMSKGGRPWS